MKSHRNLLPPWAEAYACGEYLVQGAQLSTRDGRLTSNAVVVGILYPENNSPATDIQVKIITDIGNPLTMSIEQVENQFYPPEFIMKEEERLGYYVKTTIIIA